jgi:hypothetical protein
MTFWDKKGIVTQEQAYQQATTNTPSQPIELDEVVMQELQEDPNIDIFDEEDEDMASVLSDANLRLEQGRLYQMIMNSDIFGETDADPKAIRNVQREMRKFARDRMETMLGMRQEETVSKTIVSSPFNDMEVTVLKLLASKMSKGATEETSSPIAAPSIPKKDGITAISGTTRPKTAAPLKKEAKSIQRTIQPKQEPVQPKTEESSLKKPIDQMSPQELAEYDKNASERHTKSYAKMPTNMTPMPTGAALEALYTVQANQAIQPGSPIATMMSLINSR